MEMHALRNALWAGVSTIALVLALSVAASAAFAFDETGGTVCDGICQTLFPKRTCPSLSTPFHCCCKLNGVLGCHCSPTDCVSINGGNCPDGTVS